MRWSVGRAAGVLLAGTVVAVTMLVVLSVRTEREYARLLETGDLAMGAADVSGAIEAYTGAATLRSDAMAAYLKRGLAYRQRGEFDAALRDLRRAAELDDTAPRVFEWQGDVQVTLARYSRAAENFERSLALDDRQPGVLYKLALARYRDGHAGGAIEPLQRAIALAPEMADTRYLLGISLRDVDRDDEALEQLATATRLNPGMLAAREVRASIHVAHGRYGRALVDLEALAALEPDRPERLVALGVTIARAGRRETAVARLAQAAERFPDSSAVFRALGHLWLDAADAGDQTALAKAVAALTHAVALPDADAEAHALLGRARLRTGDLAGAEQELRAAVAQLPVPAAAFQSLADVLERQRRWADAREALVRYAALRTGTTDTADLAERIGDLSMRLGDPHAAAYWFDKAIAEAGPSADLLFRDASAEASRGADRVAKTLVERGLSLDPHHAGLRALERSLAAVR